MTFTWSARICSMRFCFSCIILCICLSSCCGHRQREESTSAPGGQLLHQPSWSAPQLLPRSPLCEAASPPTRIRRPMKRGSLRMRSLILSCLPCSCRMSSSSPSAAAAAGAFAAMVGAATATFDWRSVCYCEISSWQNQKAAQTAVDWLQQARGDITKHYDRTLAELSPRMPRCKPRFCQGFAGVRGNEGMRCSSSQHHDTFHFIHTMVTPKEVC